MSVQPSNPVNQADVAGAISSFFHVATSDAAISKLLEVVYPDVQQAAARDPGSWKSVFPSVLAKYEGMAKDLGLNTDQRQRDFEILRTANHSDANFAAALARLGLTRTQTGAPVARDGAASGARFDDIGSTVGRGDPGYWATPKGLDEMRSYASNHGLAWASGYPEILKLGPSAVQALADVQLKKENYDRLRQTFKLTPADTVETAKRAKQHDVNLNDVTQSASKLDNDLPAHLKPEFRRAVKDYLPKIGDEQERARFHNRMEELRKKDPAHAPATHELEKKLHTSGAEAKKLDQKADESARRVDAAGETRKDAAARFQTAGNLFDNAAPASAALPAEPVKTADAAKPEKKDSGAPAAAKPTQDAKAQPAAPTQSAANTKAAPGPKLG